MSKNTCPTCKGNRYIKVTNSRGRDVHKKCPFCGGRGFQVRVRP